MKHKGIKAGINAPRQLVGDTWDRIDAKGNLIGKYRWDGLRWRRTDLPPLIVRMVVRDLVAAWWKPYDDLIEARIQNKFAKDFSNGVETVAHSFGFRSPI